MPTTLCASAARSTPPCSARPNVTAMMIQQVVSSMIAEVMISWPTVRRMKFISRTTIATIFTEEIDSAVPRNNDVIRRCSGCGSMLAGSNSPSAKPQTKGTAMPVSDTLRAVLRDLRTTDKSVSRPVSSSSIRMPSWETASIIAFCSRSGGKMACCRSGNNAPSTEGPSRTPAISCPITAGWPIRSIASPKTRPATKSRIIWATNTTSEGPTCGVAPPSAVTATTLGIAISGRAMRNAHISRSTAIIQDLPWSTRIYPPCSLRMVNVTAAGMAQSTRRTHAESAPSAAVKNDSSRSTRRGACLSPCDRGKLMHLAIERKS